MTSSSSLTPTEQALEAAVVAMTDTSAQALFDVTIVCTTDDHQAAYWMERLSAGVCRRRRPPTTTASSSNSSIFPLVLAVSEDWNDSNGAGNGLGTLYAWTKATELAQTLHPTVDLNALLREANISAALYHTAGKGTRLAPLPASENNNKPGVVRALCLFMISYILCAMINIMEWDCSHSFGNSLSYVVGSPLGYYVYEISDDRNSLLVNHPSVIMMMTMEQQHQHHVYGRY
jgi:hypothetical protein